MTETNFRKELAECIRSRDAQYLEHDREVQRLKKQIAALQENSVDLETIVRHIGLGVGEYSRVAEDIRAGRPTDFAALDRGTAVETDARIELVRTRKELAAVANRFRRCEAIAKAGSAIAE